MIQLHFVLQVFGKWYVLGHAARGGLFSFPTCVGCCFSSGTIENEGILWLVQGFSSMHSSVTGPQRQKGQHKCPQTWVTVLRGVVGISGCCHSCAIRGPKRMGQNIRFHLVPCGNSLDNSQDVPQIHFPGEFALWRKGDFVCPVSFVLPPHPGLWWGRAKVS